MIDRRPMEWDSGNVELCMSVPFQGELGRGMLSTGDFVILWPCPATEVIHQMLKFLFGSHRMFSRALRARVILIWQTIIDRIGQIVSIVAGQRDQPRIRPSSRHYGFCYCYFGGAAAELFPILSSSGTIAWSAQKLLLFC